MRPLRSRFTGARQPGHRGRSAVPVERTVYSALANARGGYESDVTVARLADQSFMLVTGSGQGDLFRLEQGDSYALAVVQLSI